MKVGHCLDVQSEEMTLTCQADNSEKDWITSDNETVSILHLLMEMNLTLSSCYLICSDNKPWEQDCHLRKVCSALSLYKGPLNTRGHSHNRMQVLLAHCV